jgi:predicted nucleic acid binding AN1-type Zn finger protein
MKIRTIFELIPASLYSVKYENETDHEFTRLFDLWNDTEYLEDFFETNRPKLINYWNGISTEDAVIRTRTSANRLEGYEITSLRMKITTLKLTNYQDFKNGY